MQANKQKKMLRLVESGLMLAMALVLGLASCGKTGSTSNPDDEGITLNVGIQIRAQVESVTDNDLTRYLEDKLGYKFVMVADTIVLVFVCLLYGFAHRLFGMEIAFIVCCINYIFDAVISLCSMASNVYVQSLSDSDEEMKATISTGVSINHVITIFIALFGGWIWQTLGIETLFIASAILGLCNSAYAASIKTK